MPKPLARDRIEAAKNLVMMDLVLLQAEIANGMYKKPLDAIVKQYRYDPLPDEVRAVIIAAWTRGGLLPPAAIKAMVPGNGTGGNVMSDHLTDSQIALLLRHRRVRPVQTYGRSETRSGAASFRVLRGGSAFSSQAWAWSFLASAEPG